MHRLVALIESDLQTYPKSTIKEIHSRIPDVAYKDLQKAIYQMVKNAVLLHTSDKTYRKYWMA